jgi:hypothetical protein
LLTRPKEEVVEGAVEEGGGTIGAHVSIDDVSKGYGVVGEGGPGFGIICTGFIHFSGSFSEVYGEYVMVPGASGKGGVGFEVENFYPCRIRPGDGEWKKHLQR